MYRVSLFSLNHVIDSIIGPVEGMSYRSTTGYMLHSLPFKQDTLGVIDQDWVECAACSQCTSEPRVTDSQHIHKLHLHLNLEKGIMWLGVNYILFLFIIRITLNTWHCWPSQGPTLNSKVTRFASLCCWMFPDWLDMSRQVTQEPATTWRSCTAFPEYMVCNLTRFCSVTCNNRLCQFVFNYLDSRFVFFDPWSDWLLSLGWYASISVDIWSKLARQA